ncbi:MAG TPA: hypothetical protein VKE51_10910 [Vicinamibacterales bacterium]|nr:hypothetical protein [Vicinamibacterales bacterium]
MNASGRRYRAGESLEDFCRACKTDRLHTVIAADGDGQPIRVACGFCHSEHNYRGGPRLRPSDFGGPAAHGVTSGAPVRPPAGTAAPSRWTAAGQTPAAAAARSRVPSDKEPFPIVSERERTGPAMPLQGTDDLELLLRRVIREETGISAVAPAEKWRNGTLVLRPGTPGLQEKTWPIETFFHKVVMLRNRLRTLEQQVNAAELPDDVKVKLQGYISGCYGTLTSFNVLFADEADQFKGSGGE